MDKPYETYTVVDTKHFKFGVFVERKTAVSVSTKVYNLIGSKKMFSPYHTYNKYNVDEIQEILDNEKITDYTRKLLQDCKMLLEEGIVDDIKFYKHETIKKWKEEKKKGE